MGVAMNLRTKLVMVDHTFVIARRENVSARMPEWDVRRKGNRDASDDRVDSCGSISSFLTPFS